MSFVAGAGVPVLMYHWVDENLGDRLRLYGVTPRAFGSQMRWLRAAGYAAAPLEALPSHLDGTRPLPGRRVVLTFDDGYRDNVERAGPVLEALGWTATIFVVTDHAGGVNAWDLGHGDAPRSLVTWDEMRRLDGRTFRFEPHSRTHPFRPRVDDASAREEIAGSKRRLEDELGREALAFSYPHGEFDARLEGIVREAGFRLAVTDLMGLNRRSADPLRVRRTKITSRDVAPTYAFKVATGYGVYGLVNEMRRRAAAAWRRA